MIAGPKHPIKFTFQDDQDNIESTMEQVREKLEINLKIRNEGSETAEQLGAKEGEQPVGEGLHETSRNSDSDNARSRSGT